MKLDIESRALPTTTRVAVPQTQLWQGKPDRMAWLVLFGAFFVCIALSALVPFLGYQFIRFSTDPQTASLQAANRTKEGDNSVRVNIPNVSLPIAIKDPAPVSENYSITTDKTQSSGAFITFFDSSTATISPNTQLILHDMRRPSFGWSDQPNIITVEQISGTVLYGVVQPWKHTGNPDGRPPQFLVRTPNFDAWLNPGGTYSLDVTKNGSEIAVRFGAATVQTRDGSRQILVGLGQRVIAETGKPLGDLLPAAKDLLTNGNFTEKIDCQTNTGSWKCYSDQGGDGGNVNGSAGVVTLDRNAVQIKRTGSNQNSAITGIRQIIDRDVSDFRTLKLLADVRVDAQNLSGGGYQSTEYPLILHITYKDVDGDRHEYFQGFYIQNDANNPTQNGGLIPAGAFIPFDSSNLLASLPFKPFRIESVEIYASGWDYESYVSNVRLTAE
ncbi:MAG: hypothetical protein HY741_01295 [Chloroflexi bacterium]|nr:hypothetical protein [Chloroflexota bacterium]